MGHRREKFRALAARVHEQARQALAAEMVPQYDEIAELRQRADVSEAKLREARAEARRDALEEAAQIAERCEAPRVIRREAIAQEIRAAAKRPGGPC